MFSKYVTLLAFAATAIAGVIQPGVYRITNVASQSTACTYNPSSAVFVSSTREFPGPFEISKFGSVFALKYTFNYLPQTTVEY